MIKIDRQIKAADLLPRLEKLWELSAKKIHAIEQQCPPGTPSPVFTVDGKYTTQGWTEWTQGFQYGAAFLQFDATGDATYLDLATQRTEQVMAGHLTHLGVHDHGFNNVSTYGNLWRLIREGKVDADPWKQAFCELALKITGAVQASRWTERADGGGFIHSFNGAQSLFVDTIRSCRALAVSHMLGHVLMEEQDTKINLLDRLLQHARSTADFSIYYGEGRDSYDTTDVRGRTVHEALFNPKNGVFRAPSTQQGYSPFSTWTRGLAWAICGFAEQLEFLRDKVTEADAETLQAHGGREAIEAFYRKAAEATCDFFIQHTPTDGIAYWDTGAPGLVHLGDYLDRPAEPYNDHEPVDSSASVIAAQGLIRLGQYLQQQGDASDGPKRYMQAGLTTLNSLLDEPYLSTDDAHQGLILHSIYHRPCGWDHIPEGRKIPCHESSMWGDYHMRELALCVQRLANDETTYHFYGPNE